MKTVLGSMRAKSKDSTFSLLLIDGDQIPFSMIPESNELWFKVVVAGVGTRLNTYPFADFTIQSDGSRKDDSDTYIALICEAFAFTPGLKRIALVSNDAIMIRSIQRRLELLEAPVPFFNYSSIKDMVEYCFVRKLTYDDVRLMMSNQFGVKEADNMIHVIQESLSQMELNTNVTRAATQAIRTMTVSKIAASPTVHLDGKPHCKKCGKVCSDTAQNKLCSKCNVMEENGITNDICDKCGCQYGNEVIIYSGKKRFVCTQCSLFLRNQGK